MFIGKYYYDRKNVHYNRNELVFAYQCFVNMFAVICRHLNEKIRRIN